MIGGRFKVASVASIAAAGLFMGGVAAQAADLGGNCCADLEERVAELEATTARKNNRVVSLTVYGQVSRAIVWHDDETSAVKEFTSRDNDGWSGSRFGFTGSARINGDLSAGYRIEIGVDNGDVETNNQRSPNAAAGETEGVLFRRTYVYITSASMGTIELGRENSATEGISQICLGCSGTLGSAMEGDAVSAVASTGQIDGARRNGIHYTSPSIGGFSLAASWFHSNEAGKEATTGGPAIGTSDSAWDAALRYAGEFGAIRVAAGVGYQTVYTSTGPDDTTSIMVSGSAMHTPTGLFIAGYWGNNDDEDSFENDGWGVTGGISTKFNSLGTTSFDVRYGQSTDDEKPGEDPYYYGVGVKQAIDAVAGDVFLNWNYYDSDNATDDDVNVIIGGMIVRF